MAIRPSSPFTPEARHTQYVVLSVILSNRLDEVFLVLPSFDGRLAQDEALANFVNDLRRIDSPMLGFWAIWAPSESGKTQVVEYRHFLTNDHVLNHAVLVGPRVPTDEEIYLAFEKRLPDPGEENPPPLPPVVHIREFRPVRSSEQ